MRIGSLFSGAGGLDMAVEHVFGGEVIWQSEVDKAARTVLAHRFPGVPNLGDITTADFNNVEPVDVICGGFPCQDVSAAGKRAGIKQGTRSGLWSIFADVIDQLRPTWVVIENVRGLLSARADRNVEPDEATVGDRSDGPVLRALGAVLGDLADLGYDAQWTTVAASDVGAPHRRERVFIVAHSAEQFGSHRPWSDGGEQTVVGTGPGADRGDYAGDSSPRVQIVGRSTGSESSDAPTDGIALLPTPCVVDRLATTDMTLEQWDESRRSQKERGVGSFGPRGDSLGAAVLRADAGSVDDRPDYSSSGTTKNKTAPLLPTPRSSDCFGAGQHGDGGMDLRTTVSLLPTPRATDEKGKRNPDGRERDGRIRTIGDDALPDAIARPQWGKYAPAIARWEALTRTAPAPTEPNKNSNPRLAAQFSEWMMGWPAGWVTDPDIGISRNDQLRIIGNGVCPQQATAALTWLLQIAQVAA